MMNNNALKKVIYLHSVNVSVYVCVYLCNFMLIFEQHVFGGIVISQKYWDKCLHQLYLINYFQLIQYIDFDRFINS